MKLKRSALAHYVNSDFSASTTNWFLIGKDIEELAVELNPDTEKKTNILDEQVVNDNGYAPEISADPYYANPEEAIYGPLRDIALERKTGDDCKTQYLEVIIENTSDTTHLAFMEDCIIKPQSYGGGKEGINIPYNVTPCGNRKKGTVNITNGVPSFTEDTAGMKNLTIEVTAGSASGKTQVTDVVGEPAGSTLYYKIASSLTKPKYGDGTTGYTALTQSTDLAATAGQKIIVVAVSSNTIVGASPIKAVVLPA